MFKIEQFSAWNDMTWQDMMNIARNKSSISLKGLELLESELSNSRLSSTYEQFCNCPVDGHISQGWRDKNTAGPLFQKSLDSVMQEWKDWTPAEYLIEYNIHCIHDNISIKKRDLGRALRNLPSFLREYILADLLIQRGYSVSIPTASLNASHHIDLIIHTKSGEDIYVWNYLASGKGLDFMPKKGLNRGRIQLGYNLMAPLWDSDTYTFHGWYIPTKEYIENIVKVASEPPEPYSSIKMKKKRYYEDIRLFLKT